MNTGQALGPLEGSRHTGGCQCGEGGQPCNDAWLGECGHSADWGAAGSGAGERRRGSEEA